MRAPRTGAAPAAPRLPLLRMDSGATLGGLTCSPMTARDIHTVDVDTGTDRSRHCSSHGGTQQGRIGPPPKHLQRSRDLGTHFRFHGDG